MIQLYISEVAQSCPTLCDPVDCNLPGSSIHGILQASILAWVAISFSRRSSRPRDWTRVSCLAGRRFNLWATREVYLFFIKFFSQLGYYITLGRVPSAIQKVPLVIHFKRSSGSMVHVTLFPVCFAHPFVLHLFCSQEPPHHGRSLPIMAPFPPLQDFTLYQWPPKIRPKLHCSSSFTVTKWLPGRMGQATKIHGKVSNTQIMKVFVVVVFS